MSPTILATSTDPRELVRSARLFAASADPADQAVLLSYLGTPEFLNRVDSAAAYTVYQPHQLRIAAVVRTLMEQDAPAPRQTLVGLTTTPGFNSYDLLIQLLIRAVAIDRPASPPTVAYWTKYSRADSVYSDNVVQALFANRSRPALELFERMMNDPQHEDGYKYAWLRGMLLPQRNDTEVLLCCERMVIGGTVDPGWHEPIIEALFDFDPSWYLTCRKPKPPLRIFAPTPSKDVLERIGLHALNAMQFVNPTLPLKVRLALKEIDREVKDDPGAPHAAP